MTERTYTLIRICKDNTWGGVPSQVRALKEYFKRRTGRTSFRDDELESLLHEAVNDYIDSCDRPSDFLRLLEGTAPFIERVAYAFSNVREYDRGEHRLSINGFERFHRDCTWFVRHKEDGSVAIACSDCRTEFVVPDDIKEIEKYHFCPTCGRYVRKILNS